MKKIENFITLDEETLKDLNKTADLIIEDMGKHSLDYDSLEKVFLRIIDAQKIVRYSRVDKLVPMKRETMLAVALDFFQSIDNEFYRKAIDTILNQNEKIKMRLYNFHLTKKTDERDEFGVQIYSDGASVQTENGHSTVFVPLQKKLKKDHAEKLLNKEDGSLDDLYAVVHEIAHLFDLEEDVNSSITAEDIVKGEPHKRPKTVTGDLLKEGTSIAFEFLLSNYLLSKGGYPQSVIVDHDIHNIHNAVDKARILSVEFELARIKKSKGKITNVDIDEMRKKQNISVRYARKLAKVINNNRSGPIFRNRYVMGALIASTIVNMYEEDKETGTKRIKEYIKASKSGDFQGALDILGIEYSEQGLNKMVDNLNKRKRKMFNQKGYEAEVEFL